MRAIVQRVSQARVLVEGKIVGSCGPGLLVLAAAHRDDSQQNATRLADRIRGLRIFSDEQGKMNLALADLPQGPEAQILAISNFTLYGETAKNRRPSFVEAAPYDRGKELFETFVHGLTALGLRVETGVFGAHMDVELTNDGPVTLIVDG